MKKRIFSFEEHEAFAQLSGDYNPLYFTGIESLKIFYPSSVFVEEMPSNMGEYAAAKAAGETLCRFLQATNTALKIYNPRLPKLATDQTSSLVISNASDPADNMLQHLRLFREY
jgi:hypothetical protein